MGPTVSLPTVLRPFAGGGGTLPGAGDTVGAVLSHLTTEHPNLKRHLFADTGELRRFVNVFVNSTNVRDLRGLETPVSTTDRVIIIPSIAGG
jgi:sulfur-carrier protein